MLRLGDCVGHRSVEAWGLGGGIDVLRLGIVWSIDILRLCGGACRLRDGDCVGPSIF